MTLLPFFCFHSLNLRVGRIESAIIPLTHNLDLVLGRLDQVFKERKLRKKDMENIFDSIVKDDAGIIIFVEKNIGAFTSYESW